MGYVFEVEVEVEELLGVGERGGRGEAVLEGVQAREKQLGGGVLVHV